MTVLAKVAGTTREAIRDAIRIGRTPWNDDDFAGAKQRRFGGAHAMGLVLVEMLAAQGFLMAPAAEQVRRQWRAIEVFLDGARTGRAEEAYIVAARVPVFDSLTGAGWKTFAFTDWNTADEIGHFVADRIREIGKVTEKDGGRYTRILGGPHLAVASVTEAYLVLRDRAAAAGYVIDGHDIIKASDASDVAEDEDD